MRLDWYVDVVGNVLVQNPFGPAPYTMPPLRQGDTLNLRIYLLQRTTTYPHGVIGAPSFEILNNAALSLKVAIGVKAGTGNGDHVTNQYVWAKDATNQYFYAKLPLNTPAVALAIGSAPTLDRVLELEASQDGTPMTALQQPVTIHADVIKDTSVSLPPGETALVKSYADATFAKLIGERGQVFQLRSENGQWIRTFGISNNGTRIDQVEQVAP